MRNTGNIHVVSIESRKGGIGKTTTALNIARNLLYIKQDEELSSQTGGNYNVIFLDLDITGTAATEFEPKNNNNKEKDFFDEYHIVNNPKGKKNEKLNLVELFEGYMSGKEIPRMAVGDNPEKDIIVLERGKVNIFSSFLERDYKKDKKKPHKYGPAVLFDEMHSAWFMDMLKELVEKCQAAFSEAERKNEAEKNRKLLVIVDNAPGYSGLEPAIEQWTSDLGPECGKTLFISSLDPQDFDACAKAIRGVSELYADKWDASRVLIEIRDSKEKDAAKKRDTAKRIFENLSDSQKEFLQRLVDTAPAQDDKCGYPSPNPIDHPKCKNCGLCFYRQKTGKQTDSFFPENAVNCGKFINIIFNKIPADPGTNMPPTEKTAAWLKKYNFVSFLKETGNAPDKDKLKKHYSFEDMRKKLVSREDGIEKETATGNSNKKERVHLLSTILEGKIDDMAIMYMENMALQYIMNRLEKEPQQDGK
jgi:hypothetical protein